MDPKKYQLFIDGKGYYRRGLDLAFNPHNGNVLGEVMLVSESVLKERKDDEETVRIPLAEIVRIHN